MGYTEEQAELEKRRQRPYLCHACGKTTPHSGCTTVCAHCGRRLFEAVARTNPINELGKFNPEHWTEKQWDTYWGFTQYE